MRDIFKTALFFIIISITPILAQEHEGAMPMQPPPPLDDAFMKWMIGEWKGSTSSAMGKTTDHMICEMGFNGQFMLSTYKAKGEDGSMVEGMAIMTKTPDGKLAGYWFDSWRSRSEGTGTQKGNTSTTEWTTPMGIYVRTTEKIDENTMKITGIMPGPDGTEMKSETELTRIDTK